MFTKGVRPRSPVEGRPAWKGYQGRVLNLVYNNKEVGACLRMEILKSPGGIQRTLECVSRYYPGTYIDPANHIFILQYPTTQASRPF